MHIVTIPPDGSISANEGFPALSELDHAAENRERIRARIAADRQDREDAKQDEARKHGGLDPKQPPATTH